MGIDAPRLLASAKLFLRIGTEEEDEPVRHVCERVVRALSQPPPTPADHRDASEQAVADESSDDGEDSPGERCSEEPIAKRLNTSQAANGTQAADSSEG